MIYFLTTLCFICLVAFLLWRRQSVASPSVIWCASFLLAIGSAWIGQAIWDNLELSIVASLTFVFSSILFVCASLVTEYAAANQFLSYGKKNEKILNLPILSRSSIMLICLFVGIVGFMYFFNVKEIVDKNAGAGVDYLSVVEKYRDYTISVAKGRLESVGQISLLVSFLFRCVEVLGVYVLANFIFLTSEQRKGVWRRYALCIALVALVLYVPTGSRSPLVHYIIAGFILVVLCFRMRSGKITPRLVTRTVIVLAITLVGFTLLSLLRGEIMRLGLIGYLSFFFGSGVASFNQVLDSGLLSEMAYPFTGVINLVDKIGIEIQVPEVQGVWIPYKGYDSNVFTALSSYYEYFGLSGVMLYVICVAFVMSLLYLAATKTQKVTWIATYAFFGYVIFDAIRNDALSGLVGVPLIEYVVLLIVVPAALRRINKVFFIDSHINRLRSKGDDV